MRSINGMRMSAATARKRLVAGISAFIAIFVMQACSTDDDTFDQQDRYFQELKLIDQHLAEQGITAQIDPLTGIRYVIHEQGTGLMPYVVDSVVISYTGSILGGASPFLSETSDKLLWNTLIGGIQLPLMKIQEGGSATAYVPSFYGYGQAGRSDVPPNSILEIDVELEKIYARQLRKDIATIDDTLANRGITAIQHPTGIRYTLQQGTGVRPVVTDNITIDYTGNLFASKIEFDSGSNVTFQLNRLIPGWQIMMPLVKEGGTITMYVPSPLGYGTRGAGSVIPPNANLTFEVELLKVN